MFTAENEDVLVAFQALCEQYPRENPVALWEMAGGQTAAEHSVEADEGDSADEEEFTNPYLLSGEELDRTVALRCSR